MHNVPCISAHAHGPRKFAHVHISQRFPFTHNPQHMPSAHSLQRMPSAHNPQHMPSAHSPTAHALRAQVETIDLGEEAPRTVLSGIAQVCDCYDRGDPNEPPKQRPVLSDQTPSNQTHPSNQTPLRSDTHPIRHPSNPTPLQSDPLPQWGGGQSDPNQAPIRPPSRDPSNETPHETPNETPPVRPLIHPQRAPNEPAPLSPRD